MQEQPKRKPRIPLTPEELFYVVELKKLKQEQNLQAFKSSWFYKFINRVNILFAAFLTYAIISNLMLCYWQPDYVAKAVCTYAGFDPEVKKRSIGEMDLYLTSGHYVKVRADKLYQAPQQNETVFLGRDFLFHKIVKVHFVKEARSFWNENAYASTMVCSLALIIGFFVYLINKHLTVNGLLMCLGFFVLATLYFILV